ncbi:hypothetical protein J2P12_00665, partial [Candidatus Bathyarchaeota archaeon]|nr:hypothetical protein [Candidatus Bathyarchaeota archaeon]
MSTGTGPQNAAAGWGQITELFLFQASGLPANYYGLIKSNFGFLASPTLLVVADGGAGGVLNGTYTWGITALDGAGGETLDTWLTTFAIPAGHKASLSWPAVPLATGYNIYRTAAGPVGAFLKVNSSPITATSYVDNIADGSRINTTTPLFNSTQGVWFFKLPLPTYSLSDVVTNFPADLPPIVGDGGIGGRGGGGIGGGTTGSQPPTSSGGVSGNISPIPQIMQFVNKMILILGNGYAPYQSDGTSGGTTALTNTFVASYPARTNSSPQVTGDLMALAGVLYKASQGGTTAAAPPAFNTALGQSTADGTVIWVS